MVENPMIELHEDRCKFYTEHLNKKLYGHCLIYGRGNKPIERVKDRYGRKITEAQIEWFNANCIDYPTVEDAKAGIQLLPNCGFKFEVAIDA